METQRLIKRIRNLPNNLERAYMNDISNIIDQLLEEYDICYKDTDEKVKRSILVNRFKINFLEKEDLVFCNGFSKNGNKCCSKTFEDSEYCKRHQYLLYKTNDIKTNIVVLNNPKISNQIINTENLQQKLIDDAFYYFDDTFIYEKDNLTKVGYIEKDVLNNTKNFILTDDPFILGS